MRLSPLGSHLVLNPATNRLEPFDLDALRDALQAAFGEHSAGREWVADVVLDALRWKAHPTHFNIFQAEDEFHRIGARHAWLTHLTHDILYERDSKLVAPGCTLAYDGLTFNFDA